MSPDIQRRLVTIFHPYVFKARAEVEGQKKFVHYTSATAAMSILRKKEVWMRNVSMMNDMSEVHHGIDCLVQAYRAKSGQELKHAVEGWFPGLSGEIEKLFNDWQHEMKFGTYVSCFSVHNANENRLGRLSMWRAYGGTSPVALVLNSDPFFAESDVLNAYTSPVEYMSYQEFEPAFDHLAKGIIENGELMASIDRQEFANYLFRCFLFAAVCTKHDGFKEEQEWRVIHFPKIFASGRHAVKKSVETVRDKPEVVYKIPLCNIRDEGLVGIEIPELLDRVIIGPTDHPFALYDAFIELLEEARVPDAAKKVSVSSIPLRR